MRSTIDSAGRVVVPQAMRDEIGWRGGEAIEIEVVDGGVLISPVTMKMTLVEGDEGVYAVAEEELPPLTTDIVDATRRSVRR